LKNKSKISEANAAYYAENKERFAAKTKRWQEANPGRRKEIYQKWFDSNPGKINAKTARRRAAKLQATPPWLTAEQKAEIEVLYIKAKQLGMHVDHIMPLKGKNFSGLHVPWNLQLLTPEENFKKSNKLF
jgi:5-methylcytosine-specific restriction endonuclease McrA